MTKVYTVNCSNYIKIYPNSTDTSETNRLPKFAFSFFVPTKKERLTADSLIVNSIPDNNRNIYSAKHALKDIKISDRYYVGYINKNGDKKILVLFDPIYIYDGPMPPTIADYTVPLSINLTKKTVFFIADKDGNKSYFEED
jgi:hypothetical protein